ncbi:MAG TPA: hypothetical protein VHY82_04280 [Acetobacteraceae bacterium]|nr:hypothetical protein [Acetobacteraceae bacterium]
MPDDFRGASRDAHVDQSSDGIEHMHEAYDDQAHALTWPDGLRIVLVALAAAAVWFHVWEPLPSVSLIGVVGLLIGGWPILHEACANLIERRMTMELSMTIAIIAASAIGQFFTAWSSRCSCSLPKCWKVSP